MTARQRGRQPPLPRPFYPIPRSDASGPKHPAGPTPQYPKCDGRVVAAPLFGC